MSRHAYPFAKPQNRPKHTGLPRSVHEQLQKALKLHQSGKFNEAQPLYQRILTTDARYTELLYLLGMAEFQGGRHASAEELVGMALGANPKEARYCSDLGTVLQAQGKIAEAKQCYEQALLLKPDYAEAFINLGTVVQAEGLADDAAACYARALELKPQSLEAEVNLSSILCFQKRFEEAAVHCERAIAIKQSCIEAWYNLGNIRHAQGRLNEAIAAYERAISINPAYLGAHANLGTVLQDQGKIKEALACYQKVLTLRPNHAEVLTNLGNILHTLGKLDESVASHQLALHHNPHLPEAHYNWGNVLQNQDKPAEALVHYEQAVALRPQYAEAHYNWGCAIQAVGNLDEALAKYRHAASIKPDYTQAHFSASLAQLLAGDFAAGWSGYEWRWQTKDHETKMRGYEQPLWKGEKLSSSHLLIWGEQGIGDEIMFSGLIPDVLRTGTSCILDCDVRLQPLFARSFPDVQVISSRATQQDLQVEFSAHLPCGSLPEFFRTTESAFASTTSPYLIADPNKRNALRERYANRKPIIGLAWFTKNQKTGRNRSIALSQFATLFEQTSARWISLQYGNHQTLEEEASTANAPLFVDRGVNQFGDMDLFAAQVAAMDLIITIDNSTAHLAGALGVPTWLLLPFAPDWRWLQQRDNSPWYPTLSLFRQPQIGDWNAVIEALVTELAAHPFPGSDRYPL